MITSETVTEAVDSGAPIGPAEAEETAFLAEQQLSNPPKVAAISLSEAEESNLPLPPMDELIQRIPASTRELMDQLFRAKFITVKRLPVSVFKTQN
jgi:hypothetical protein